MSLSLQSTAMPPDPDRHPRFIPAYKHGWPRLAVSSMILRRTRRAFRTVRVQGLEALRSSLDANPGGTLLLANHSSWWDLFLVHVLNETVPLDGYGMMEHFNMRRFGFFRRIGAFSVDRTDPASVRASLDYAAGLLRRDRAGVWIFPQGRIEANDARPLRFQSGLRVLVKRAGPLRVVPVAFRYEFWQDERPEAFVRFGAPETARVTPDLLPHWEGRLAAELDALRADVLAQDPARFTPLLEGSRSISTHFARVRARFRGEVPGAPAE
jgi:1-acyl-sn-glycerol-3-phosphate acyltransferase